VSTAKLADVLVMGTAFLLRIGIPHVLGDTAADEEDEELTWEYVERGENEQAGLLDNMRKTAEVNILDVNHDDWLFRSRFPIVYSSSLSSTSITMLEKRAASLDRNVIGLLGLVCRTCLTNVNCIC
jgi:hypothetical protein